MEMQTTQQEEVRSNEGLIEWNAYGTQYDSMCAINPAYAENIELITEFARSIKLDHPPKICDLGAGTGNFVVALHSIFPHASFDHIDSSEEMNMHASAKYKRIGINAEIYQEPIQEKDLGNSRYDIIVCVNALFYAAPQDKVLKNIRRALKPDGHFLVIDFGRRQKILDWTGYVLKNLWRDKGLAGLYKFLRENREGFKQNRRAAMDQKNGAMWLHSTTEFKDTLEREGFRVKSIRRCYRDYCDFAICTPEIKTSSTTQPPSNEVMEKQEA